MGGWVWCPFSFYRTSVDVEVLYASIFGINLQRTREFTAANLSFPECWAYVRRPARRAAGPGGRGPENNRPPAPTPAG